MAVDLLTWWRRRLLTRAVGSCDETGLIQAIHQKNLSATKQLLAIGVSANAMSGELVPALSLAIRQAEVDIISLLLANGSSLEAVDSRGNTALMEAISLGDRYIFQMILDRKPNVNARNWRGKTALLLAAEEGSTTFVRLLLNEGAEVDLADQAGVTPLMVSVSTSKTGIAKSLLDAGANPEQKDLSGRSASDRSTSSLRIQRMLQEKAHTSHSSISATSVLPSDLLSQQFVHFASQWLGDPESLQRGERQGRLLISKLQSALQSIGLPDSDSFLQTGASLGILMLQEFQRGLGQLQANSHQAGTSSLFSKIEELISQFQLSASAREPGQKAGQEQHIHFHFPAMTSDQAQALAEAVREIMSQSGNATVTSQTPFSESFSEKMSDNPANSSATTPHIEKGNPEFPS